MPSAGCCTATSESGDGLFCLFARGNLVGSCRSRRGEAEPCSRTGTPEPCQGGLACISDPERGSLCLPSP